MTSQAPDGQSAGPRPCRSLLYIPASNDRAMAKARDLPADGIIFDLEDAVAPQDKAAARKTLAQALGQGGFGRRLLLLRINALDTPWGQADVAALADAPADALLVPKVDGPAMLDAVRAAGARLPLWAMMETCRGILNAGAIADHPAMAGFVVGTNDLARELGSLTRAALAPSLHLCLLAARAAAIPCIDGVYNAFRDAEGLAAECAEGRQMGFDGKSLIHPAQVEIANRAFAPTAAEIDLAERQIAAWQQAQSEGRAIAIVDGRIVENLHIVSARAVLARAAAVSAEEAT